MAEIELLKKGYLFESLTDDELVRVAGIARERALVTGDYVFEEGGMATSLFLVKQGTIEVLKKGSPTADVQSIASLSAGAYFGEMAFVDKAKRAASAVARENSQLLEVPYEPLEKLLVEQTGIGLKVYRSLSETLCRRIRQTTTNLSSLKELTLRHI